ncbi:MAG: hypothetical protein K2Y21_02160 [Phycisphaerales bacterium]|nr:hypothetical protein [Phycisphaerales bacterium]
MFLLEHIVAFAFLSGALLILEIAYQVGVRVKPKEATPQLATVQGATLGLLGLLLGFSFSGATSRFIDRQDIVVREANALGTAYLRADLFKNEQAQPLREALRSYADARIELFSELDTVRESNLRHRLATLQAQTWKAGTDAVAARPEFAALILNPLNEMFDLLATRDSVAKRHIPPIVLTLLCGCAAMSIATIGYGCGLQRRRGLASVGSFAVLIAVSLWIIIDFDYPRRGLIQVSPTPLLEARAAMRP